MTIYPVEGKSLIFGLAYIFYIYWTPLKSTYLSLKSEQGFDLKRVENLDHITNRLKLKLVNMKLLHCQVHSDCHLFELLLMEPSS